MQGFDIVASRRGAVAGIGFNRPQKKNALTWEMYEALVERVREAEADDSVRAILFHGTPEVFTAGNDLEDFLNRPPRGEDAPVFRFLLAVAGAAKPLVAAATGPAVGLGTTLLLHCEVVVAGDNARFSLPFAQLGLVPEFASSYLLPLIAGYQRAAGMFLRGEAFGPQEAREAGFVTRIVPAAEALETGWEEARRLAAMPPESMRLTKALLKRAHAAAVQSQLSAESATFRELLAQPAAREALAAFLEKRKPR
jgi:enoyl-CoA hydratase/carnithine racemase